MVKNGVILSGRIPAYKCGVYLELRYRKKLHVTHASRNMFHVTIWKVSIMTTTHINTRVQKHRNALRMAGLRPVQIWVPDTRRPDFAEECRRQCRVVARAEEAEAQLENLMDEIIADVDGWTE